MDNERHLKSRKQGLRARTNKNGWLREAHDDMGIIWQMWNEVEGKVYMIQVHISAAELTNINRKHIAHRLRIARYKITQSITAEEKFHE